MKDQDKARGEEKGQGRGRERQTDRQAEQKDRDRDRQAGKESSAEASVCKYPAVGVGTLQLVQGLWGSCRCPLVCEHCEVGSS